MRICESFSALVTGSRTTTLQEESKEGDDADSDRKETDNLWQAVQASDTLKPPRDPRSSDESEMGLCKVHRISISQQTTSLHVTNHDYIVRQERGDPQEEVEMQRLTP